jgi:hypothetical protein
MLVAATRSQADDQGAPKAGQIRPTPDDQAAAIPGESPYHPGDETMTDEQRPGDANDGAEYEEITSEEVDRVVERLEALMETVSSENIKAYLEEAVNNIFFLLYSEDDVADAA